MMRSVAILAFAGLCAASDVVTGTKDNFPDLIKEGVVLAEFYAPWCGHCKKLAPEWEKAATELKGKATLVAVDATIESDLGSKYEVQGYPTIKAFLDGGDAMDYEGGRTAAEIVAWVSKMTGPAVKDVADEAALSALKDENKVLVTGFFASAEDESAVAFGKFAKQKRTDYVFAAVYGDALAKASGASVPSVVVFKHFDNKKDVLEGAFEAEKVTEFVKASSFRLFDEIGPENYKDYVARGLPLGWLFVDPADEAATKAAKEAVEAVAQDHKGKVSFVWLSGAQYGQMAERVGLSGKRWPSFGIDDNGEHYAFDESKDLASADFKSWCADFAAGKLSPTVKSEDAPEQATTDGLTVLVGSTFNEIVMDESKDVFIKFYAPWCGHCKSMIPAYAEVAKTFEKDESIVIAKIDATANDTPKDFSVQGFPTLMMVKSGSNEIVKFEGGRDADAMEKFIRENAASLK